MNKVSRVIDVSKIYEPGYQARFYVADWHVDTDSNRLCRGEIDLKLESKVMAVLVYLAQHKGELVTREQLEQAIWGKTIVGYDALTGCVAKLRKALCDDSRQPRYIETISKKGYRLIAPLSDADHGSVPDQNSNTDEAAPRPIIPSRFPILMVIGAIALTVLTAIGYRWFDNTEISEIQTHTTDLPSIVVLPFANMSGDPEQSYFSDGVTTDITTALSKLSGLFVISQSSAGGYRDSPPDIKQVAGSLGVRYVLQGTVRRTEDRLRVNVSLIDANTNILLWSEKYDRELRNVFAVQDDITTNIVNALSVKLTEEEKRRTAHKYTVSLDAYDDFLRGQALYIHRTKEDNRLARVYYQQAIDRDEAFARAYSAMAMTYMADHRHGWNESDAGLLGKALQLANQGVALDRDLPQAYWVLSYVHLFRQEYAEAAQAADRAVEYDPNFADSYLTLAVCKIHFGAAEEALRLVKKAMLLNPEYPAPYASVMGQAYFFMGEYDKAVMKLREAIDRNYNLVIPHVFLIVALSKQNRMDDASWEAEQFKSVAPNFSTDSVADMLPIQDAAVIRDVQNQLQRAGL
jgi:TolB-like protein/DNA-binding winged helix-turn-helix (wHTH) protein